MAFPSYLVAEESWTHASVSESPSIITTPCKGNEGDAEGGDGDGDGEGGGGREGGGGDGGTNGGGGDGEAEGGDGEVGGGGGGGEGTSQMATAGSTSQDQPSLVEPSTYVVVALLGSAVLLAVA